MANPAPVLRLSGLVHGNPRERFVDALEPQPAQRDEATGTVMRRAREGRPAYTVHDLTVLTESGGFVQVVFRDQAIKAADGYMPKAADVLDGLPVYAFVQWSGPEGGRYCNVALSFAGDVWAAEQREKRGSRVAAAS